MTPHARQINSLGHTWHTLYIYGGKYTQSIGFHSVWSKRNRAGVDNKSGCLLNEHVKMCSPPPSRHPSIHPPTQPLLLSKPREFKKHGASPQMHVRDQKPKCERSSDQHLRWSKDHQPNPDRCREEGKKEKVFSSINQASLGSPHRLTHTNLLCINACGNLHVAQS